jgi:hypothetical protein
MHSCAKNWERFAVRPAKRDRPAWEMPVKPNTILVGSFCFLGGALLGCFFTFWALMRFNIPGGGPLHFGVGAAIGGVAGVFFFAWRLRQEQEYHEEMTGLAEATQFRYTPRLDRKELGPLLQLPILKSSSAVRHRMVRTDDILSLEMIDVCHIEGQGSHGGQNVWRTVILLPGGASGLPEFTLRPLDKTARPLFGLVRPGGITFDPPPTEEDAAAVAAFAKHYLLSVLSLPPDEAAERSLAEKIRQVFSLEVLRYFANCPGWEVQVKNGNLALWQGKTVCPVEDRPALLVDALQIHEVLTHDHAVGCTVLPGSYRRDMYQVSGIVGAVTGGVVLGGFLGGIVGLILMVALLTGQVNLGPDGKFVLAWVLFLGCPLFFAVAGGFVGYRLRRGHWPRAREG